MPSMAFQHGVRFPTEISHLSKLSTPIAQDSPAASYATLATDELLARGVPINQKNLDAILQEVVNAKSKKFLRTARLQRIWDTLYTNVGVIP